MRIAWFNQGKYEFGSAILIYSHAGLRSRGRQIAEEIWTCDLIQIWASLCVAGRDSIEYLWGVLYYVLLHVLNHYNIQIVWGFQLYAFPELHTVLMCACDWCFIVFNSAKLMINVEEVMYYACILQKCIIRIISVNKCQIIQNFYNISIMVLCVIKHRVEVCSFHYPRL